MRGFMDQRFFQVLEGLAALQPDLKRKDARGGDVARSGLPPTPLLFRNTGENC